MQIRLYYISISLALFATAILFSSSPLWAENETSVNELYQSHCASCHGEGRLGLMGPALLPESLERTPKPLAAKKIRDGAIATQMPAFKNTLSEEQIAALTEYIYKPLATLPSWGEKQINSSRVIYHDISQLPSKPIYQGDILNIFLAVELGDQHVSVIDGDNFSVLHRFSTRPALHGGIKYSPDGRFAYLASRDGWISIFDVYNFKTIAEVRAGINTRNIAVSRNGKYLIVGNYLPHTVVILDALTLNLLEFLPVASKDGITSRVSAVYDAGPQQSFVVALKDVPEMWEISYRHSPTKTGSHFFSTRRIALSNVLDDFFFDDDFKHILGASRTGECSVIELASGKLVKKLKLEGMPHLGSGIMWTYQGKRVMATPNLKQGLISIIDTSTWSIIKNIETQGPGFFLRSHENSPYAWADVSFGPNKDLMHLIDKSTLSIAKTVKPVPGKTSAHVEFSRNGSHALLSIYEQDGEILVYDANSLEIIKRLPMKKPSGKYNIYNKINLSEGTSR